MNENLTTTENPWDATTQAPLTDSAPASTAADPWSAADNSNSISATQSAGDAWGNPSQTSADTAQDWLTTPSTLSPENTESAALNWWQQITTEGLPIQDGINHGLSWLVEHTRPFFQSVRAPIDATLTGTTDLLSGIPWPGMVIGVALLAWQFAGTRLAIGSAIALTLVALCGIWPEAMVTLALVLTSLLFCVLIGLPAGVLLASNDRAQRWMRPLLDAMQTTPAFVYLVPVVMLFGIGNVPGVIVTIVFALPPLIRLTNLGLRQVRPDLIEASRAYGASPWQLLWKVQLPLAMPSIMAGINQALMLSLSMVVIASMIAVGGLGQMVLRGIGRLDMGLATLGGLGIVLLAIVLDRLTQSIGKKERGHTRWWQNGPLGLLTRLRGPSSERATASQQPRTSPLKKPSLPPSSPQPSGQWAGMKQSSQ